MPTEDPQGNSSGTLGARLPFLGITDDGPTDRSLAAWAQYLASLLTAAQRAVVRGDEAACENVKRDLVWFLRSTPPSAAELDRCANMAIADLDEDGAGAATRLRARLAMIGVSEFASFAPE